MRTPKSLCFGGGGSGKLGQFALRNGGSSSWARCPCHVFGQDAHATSIRRFQWACPRAERNTGGSGPRTCFRRRRQLAPLIRRSFVNSSLVDHTLHILHGFLLCILQQPTIGASVRKACRYSP